MFEIISIGFGEFTAAALRAIAMLFGGTSPTTSSPIITAATLAFTLAIFFAVGKMLMQAKLEIVPLILAVIVFYILFIPKVTVVVHDKITDRIDVVDHVPLGVALAGSVTSQAGTLFSELMQTTFYSGQQTHQNQASYFAYPLRLLLSMRDLTACDLGPAMCVNAQRYEKSCIGPLKDAGIFDYSRTTTYDGGESAQEYYFNENNSLLGPYLQQTMVQINRVGEGDQFGTCVDLAKVLWDSMDDTCSAAIAPASASNCSQAQRHFLGFVAQRMPSFNDSNAPTGDGGQAGIEPEDTQLETTAIRDQISVIIPALQENRNFVANQVIMNMQAAGGAAHTAEAFWMTQMMETQRLSTATEASGFLRISFFVMGIMQFIFIAMTPVVAVVALAKLGAGFKVYGGWLLLGIWSASFMVVVTIIDYWAVTTVRSKIIGRFEAEMAASAMSLPGMQGLYNHIADTLTTANTFMTAAPIILLAMLTGSIYPMAALAGRLAGGPDVGPQAGVNMIKDTGAGMMAPNQTTLADSERGSLNATQETQARTINFTAGVDRQLSEAHGKMSSAQNSYNEARDDFQTSGWALVQSAATANTDSDVETNSAGFTSALFSAVSQSDALNTGMSVSQQAHLMNDAAVTRGVGFDFKRVVGVNASAQWATRAGFTDQAAAESAVRETWENAKRLSENGQLDFSSNQQLTQSIAEGTTGQISEQATKTESTRTAYQETRTEVDTWQTQSSSTQGTRLATAIDVKATDGATTRLENEYNSGIGDVIKNLATVASHNDPGFMARIEPLIPNSNKPEDVHRAMYGIKEIAADPNASADTRMAAMRVATRFYDTGGTTPDSVLRSPLADVDQPSLTGRVLDENREQNTPARVQSHMDGIQPGSPEGFGEVAGAMASNQLQQWVSGHLRGLGMSMGRGPQHLVDDRNTIKAASVRAGLPQDSLPEPGGVAQNDMANHTHHGGTGGIRGRAENSRAENTQAENRRAENTQALTQYSTENTSGENQFYAAFGTGGLTPAEVRDRFKGVELEPEMENRLQVADSKTFEHWRENIKDRKSPIIQEHGWGGLGFIPDSKEDVADYIQSTRFDELFFQHHGTLVHSESVNGAVARLAQMSTEDFADLRTAFYEGRGDAALQEHLGLINPGEDSIGSFQQRNAAWARPDDAVVESGSNTAALVGGGTRTSTSRNHQAE